MGHDLLSDIFLDPHNAVFQVKTEKSGRNHLENKMEHFSDEAQASSGSQQSYDTMTRRCVGTVLQALSPVDDPLQRELLFKLVEAAGPVVTEDFLKNGLARISLEPRPNFKWVKNIGFLMQVLKMPMLTDSLLISKLALGQDKTQQKLQQQHEEAIRQPQQIKGFSLSQWEMLSAAFTTRVLPREQSLSKITLSKGVQHSSSLVVVQMLDVVMQLLARVQSQLEIERHAALDRHSRRLAAELDVQVSNWLAQRLPHVSVIASLMLTEACSSGRELTAAVTSEIDPANTNSTSEQQCAWSDQERVWIRLRASRALLWYAKVMPSVFAAESWTFPSC
jgi:hypothetical protein